MSGPAIERAPSDPTLCPQVNTATATLTHPQKQNSTAVCMPDQEGVKKRKHKVTQSEGRAIIASVFHFLRQEYKMLKLMNHDKCDLSPLANVRRRTAEATGVSERTVSQILKEEKELPSPSTKWPVKKRRKRHGKFDLSNLNVDIIRSSIQNFQLEQHEKPTLAKLKLVLYEKIGFDGSLSTLRRILKELGYKCQKMSKKEHDKNFGITHVASNFLEGPFCPLP